MKNYKRHREFEVHLVTYDGEQHLRLHGWLKRNDVIVKMESIHKKDDSFGTFTIYINNSHGSLPQINIFEQQDVGAYQTFVIADKIVLIGGDNLKINGGSSANFDVTYTYVDQNWS